MAFGDTESINLESPGRSLYKKRRDFSARAPGRKRTMFVSSLFFFAPARCLLALARRRRGAVLRGLAGGDG